MGPDDDKPPHRAKYHWDIRTPPGTDGKGSQEGYFRAVKDWKDFHDALPKENSNKIIPELQGLILRSQLQGRALELCLKLDDKEIKSSEGR